MMKRPAPLLALALTLAAPLAGCADSAPVSLGRDEYGMRSYEDKATLYPKLAEFCRARGGEFNEIYYERGREAKFSCARPMTYGGASASRLDLYLH